MLKHLLAGSSLSSYAVYAAKDTGTAEAQGMNTNLTHVVSQDPANVFNFICKTLEGIHKQSVSLVCGIAQLFIVRTFHIDDEQRWKAERTRDWLKAQLNERGLKQAMVYRYIATGQELARLIQKKYAWGGVMHEILAAETENKGFNTIHRCVMDHNYLPAVQTPPLQWLMDADGKPRFSLDVLRVNLGLDKLDPTKQPGYTAPAPAPTQARPGANAAEPVIPSAPATKASPASVLSRVQSDPDVLKGLSPETMAGVVEKVIGRETMAERLISLCTLEECVKLQTVLNERMKALAEAPKEAAPAEDEGGTKEAMPTDQEGKAVEQAEPTSGRRRNRRQNTA